MSTKPFIAQIVAVNRLLAHRNALALAIISLAVPVWAQNPHVGYYIINAGTGLVLDIPNCLSGNGAGLVQSTLSSTAWCEQWGFISIPGTSYYKISGGGTQVLDVPGGSTVNGQQIQQWDPNSNGWQDWELVPITGTAFYNIKNVFTGLVLDVPMDSQQPGTIVQQWQANGSPQQNWELLPITRNLYTVAYTIMNAASNFVLDVPSDLNWDGTLIQEWQSNGAPQQFWKLVPVANTPYFQIMKLDYSGSVLDVPSGSTSNGTYVQIWSPAGTPQQNWQLVPVPGTQYFHIINERSGLLLDVPGGSTVNGTHIQQWQAVGTPEQNWILYSSVQSASSGGDGSCSQSACYSQCNQTNSACTYANGDSRSCGTTAAAAYEACVSGCFPGTASLQLCLDSCLINEVNEDWACQTSAQQTTEACSAELHACQDQCSQCTLP